MVVSFEALANIPVEQRGFEGGGNARHVTVAECSSIAASGLAVFPPHKRTLY